MVVVLGLPFQRNPGIEKESSPVTSKGGFASGVLGLDWRLSARWRELPAFAESLKLRSPLVW